MLDLTATQKKCRICGEKVTNKGMCQHIADEFLHRCGRTWRWEWETVVIDDEDTP